MTTRSAGGVCQLEAESISPQLASPLQTSTLHHALSGMEEKDKKENVCSSLLFVWHGMH